ncbi:YihY family inner membrane protein [Acidovorax sp. HDW3]|uniref:YihY family inner membrane protein n=1 Tax=Acidovorax sp. HDW3 TaxID=2714923 RepID=UPI00140846BC|nr:YhjD/YihY/BrkB family envelope integrity protein [Acidovorax sp. HDW3]QIL43506.1 YihY family inner membrane protein [Acidovorax sp. HDW3]
MAFTLLTLAQHARALPAQLARFPWRSTLHMLRARFREDKLGLTASSLTFTTMLALVPFATVALAAFTAFPIFGKAQELLQRWLIDSLIPETIARQVLGYITQFAAKASRLGVVGFSMLLLTALMLILTIDRTLNTIWRVRRLRPLGQRVLIYWAALTLGPLLLGLSLAFTSYVASASRGLVGQLPGGLRLAFDSFEFLVLAAGMAGLYHYVPNTQVRWRDAWAGGLFVAIGMELAKKILALYLAQVPTYSLIYGTFATLPILLLWVYVVWVLVLLGAVVTAYLPSLLAGVARPPDGPGAPLALALETLGQLQQLRQSEAKGLRLPQLAAQLRVDALQLEPVLEALCALDWVGPVTELHQSGSEQPPRFVLLVELASTPLAPLLQRLLLARTPSLEPLWQRAALDYLLLADVVTPLRQR